MKEGRVLPILFNSDMVRAIMARRKKATRRAVKYDRSSLYDAACACGKWNERYGDNIPEELKEWYVRERILPRYRKGDILYVREAWAKGDERFLYMADCKNPETTRWKPSIHMPKEAARIWLNVTDVRLERLHDITEEQARDEGVSRIFDDMPDEEYEVWARKNGEYRKKKEDWGYRNYLWHGHFGKYGTGDRMSDAWEYQLSSYDNAIGSFSSLWNRTLPLDEWDTYGWGANPYVFVIEFEPCENPEREE